MPSKIELIRDKNVLSQLLADTREQLAAAKLDGEQGEKSHAADWFTRAERLSRLEPPFQAKNIAICLASAYRQGMRAAQRDAARQREGK